ncbi:hypothetical protein CCP3SC15_1540008 [Gammaproteobacteria bacterium]
MTAIPAVRDATARAFHKLPDEQKAELLKIAGELVETLKACCPTIQLSPEAALEIIGAAYAWKIAHKPGMKNAHLCTLAKEPQPPAKTS